MKCPYCNKEMEKGYIQSKHGLGWNRKKRVLAVSSGWFADQPLEYESVAYRCGDCKKIIIDIISRKNKIFHKRVANAVSQNWEFA